MGFLDKAKKLAEQAKELAEQATKAAEGALGEARARSGSGGGDRAEPAPAPDPRLGTSYVPGMLGRPGWREEGLADPAAVLPIDERDRAGVPHTIKSDIVEEQFGMGRRWTADGVGVGLFYRLHADHQGWEPPEGRTPVEDIEGASQATLGDGRTLVFLPGPGAEVVLETDGIDESTRSDLAQAVARQLAGG